jgi:hypothetical protein
MKSLDISRQRKLMLRKYALMVNGLSVNRSHRKDILELALQGGKTAGFELPPIKLILSSLDTLNIDEDTLKLWTEPSEKKVNEKDAPKDGIYLLLIWLKVVLCAVAFNMFLLLRCLGRPRILFKWHSTQQDPGNAGWFCQERERYSIQH